MLPFTRDAFLELFAAYNRAVWQVLVVAYGLGLTTVFALAQRSIRLRNEMPGAAIGLMWIWTGAVYQWRYFAELSPVGRVFGAMFVVHGLLTVTFSMTGNLEFGGRGFWRSLAGWMLLVFALIGYPFVNYMTGHRYPAMPTFGVTPCPTTLFTLGALLLASRPAPMVLVVVPLIWSLVGGSAAILLDIKADWIMLAAGPLVAAAVFADNWRPRHHRHARLASSGRVREPS